MGASGQIRQWSRLGDDKHLFRRASGESRRDRYWRLKRELNEKWGLGVEGYSEIEILPMLGPSTTRRIVSVPSLIMNSPTPREGPSAVGGVLFGLSDAVSDFTYKFDLEVEF